MDRSLNAVSRLLHTLKNTYFKICRTFWGEQSYILIPFWYHLFQNHLLWYNLDTARPIPNIFLGTVIFLLEIVIFSDKICVETKLLLKSVIYLSTNQLKKNFFELCRQVNILVGLTDWGEWSMMKYDMM